MYEKERRKDNKKTILISCITLFLVAVIIAILLLVRYCGPRDKDTPKEKQSYLFNFETSSVTESTSLEDKVLSLTTEFINQYRCEIIISSGASNAMLGSYQIHDFMYRSYGRSENTLSISVIFKDVSGDTPKVITDYEELEYILYMGDKDNHSILTSGFTVNEQGTLSYQSSDDIYLYKLSLGVKL